VEPFNDAFKSPNQELVRVSITIDKATRRRIRIAAAYADVEVSDWVTHTLRDAAERTIRAERPGPEEAPMEPTNQLAPEIPEAG
jgi:hypothetical protein